jgi:hypothetical protein
MRDASRAFLTDRTARTLHLIPCCANTQPSNFLGRILQFRQRWIAVDCPVESLRSTALKTWQNLVATMAVSMKRL